MSDDCFHDAFAAYDFTIFNRTNIQRTQCLKLKFFDGENNDACRKVQMPPGNQYQQFVLYPGEHHWTLHLGPENLRAGFVIKNMFEPAGLPDRKLDVQPGDCIELLASNPDNALLNDDDKELMKSGKSGQVDMRHTRKGTTQTAIESATESACANEEGEPIRDCASLEKLNRNNGFGQND
eukprot:CAMPEP_0116545984 /NCGR_PEP_ID=MMETSP0397-20121206/2977_1 /TAXON_ID=216820 /ORGANISM="Cyclophora tenuis, Strain ECT3854" /LENGTH=179 /DNA_ID=CAMNT_0004070369 /DNA_START=6 /DNA_END=545 /DNA_ORIENTATION=-